jgi:uncharacterized protein
MAHAEAAALHVEVLYCPGPGRIDAVELMLPAGSTLADALRSSGICTRHGLDEASVTAGIWGRVQPLPTPLRDRDRVELYRPLQVDPKEARRLRYKRAKRGTTAG